eukprot:c20136_g1_i1.p1 GENE.c20136_g1_i1~~c20136_g1_i1.p1  ORF type:complete len:527 (+),score=98.19 c20136_g1_i1:86-1582(+)
MDVVRDVVGVVTEAFVYGMHEDHALKVGCLNALRTMAFSSANGAMGSYPALFDTLVEMLGQGNKSEVENVMATLAGLCSDDENKSVIAEVTGLWVAIEACLKVATDQVKEWGAHLLYHLTQDRDTQAAVMASPGILTVLVDMVAYGSETSKLHAARTLCNLSLDPEAGPTKLTIASLPSLLTSVVSLLYSPSDTHPGESAPSSAAQLQEIAAQLLSVLTLDRVARRKVTDTPGTLPGLALSLLAGTDACQENAARALGNIALDRRGQVKILGCNAAVQALREVANMVDEEGDVPFQSSSLARVPMFRSEYDAPQRRSSTPNCILPESNVSRLKLIAQGALARLSLDTFFTSSQSSGARPVLVSRTSSTSTTSTVSVPHHRRSSSDGSILRMSPLRQRLNAGYTPTARVLYGSPSHKMHQGSRLQPHSKSGATSSPTGLGSRAPTPQRERSDLAFRRYSNSHAQILSSAGMGMGRVRTRDDAVAVRRSSSSPDHKITGS